MYYCDTKLCITFVLFYATAQKNNTQSPQDTQILEHIKNKMRKSKQNTLIHTHTQCKTKPKRQLYLS